LIRDNCHRWPCVGCLSPLVRKKSNADRRWGLSQDSICELLASGIYLRTVSDRSAIELQICHNQLAASDPRGFLSLYPDGAIIDEVQHEPKLLSYLQTLIDENRRAKEKRQKLWILTGSQQFGLLSKVSQSLAGRVGIVQLLPFSLMELQQANHEWADQSLEGLLWNGLYPVPVDQRVPSHAWYANYFATYVERDVRQMVNIRDLSSFRTFVRMCAARTSQQLNLAALANDCGISSNTAKGWLSILEASYIIFLLPQHHVNFGKRLTKSPKLYFYDTGLASWLTQIKSSNELRLSSMRGALFETWAVSEAIKTIFNHQSSVAAHYWRDQTGNEVDLLLDNDNELIPIEFKSGKTLSKDGFGSLNRYLGLAKTLAIEPTMVYGGVDSHVRQNVQALGWKDYPTWLASLIKP
jgi:uncharacterized protein